MSRVQHDSFIDANIRQVTVNIPHARRELAPAIRVVTAFCHQLNSWEWFRKFEWFNEGTYIYFITFYRLIKPVAEELGYF